MKTLTDKVQQEAIRISGRIEFWKDALTRATDNRHLYNQFKEREENKYYILTGEKYNE
jgi:hypothetical protein